VRAEYGTNSRRLVYLETTHDPGNLSRLNLNIPPRSYDRPHCAVSRAHVPEEPKRRGRATEAVLADFTDP
jgi:hypothetical protein